MKKATDGAVKTMTMFNEPVNILLVDDDSRNLDVLDSILACPEYRLFRARKERRNQRAAARDG